MADRSIRTSLCVSLMAHLGLVISSTYLPQGESGTKPVTPALEVRLVPTPAALQSADDSVIQSAHRPGSVHEKTPEMVHPEPSVMKPVAGVQENGAPLVHTVSPGQDELGPSAFGGAGAGHSGGRSDLSPGSGPSVYDDAVSGGGGSGGSEGERDDLLGEFLVAVRARLEHVKRYPWSARLAQEEGTVLVEFQITPEGKALDIQIAAPSPSRVLNDEAIATVKRVGEFPLPPRGFGKGGVRITVPLTYTLY